MIRASYWHLKRAGFHTISKSPLEGKGHWILVSQGRHPSEIAAELGVGESTTRRDISYLMDIARQDIKTYVQEKLPPEYLKSLATSDNIKKRAFEIADIGDRDKILALRLAAETKVSKVRLLAEGPVS